MTKQNGIKKAPPIRVLLVDDEHEVTELWAYTMRKEPYILNTATSAQEAMDIFRNEPADILVTDIKMPGIDGLELARKILENFPATQIIVVTAHGDIDTAVEAMKLGATDFLQKPIHNRVLSLSIESAAEKWRLRKALEMANEERKRMEVLIHRAQKMEAIGMMAGGVAHDLNNILSGILSYPELMLLDLPRESPLRRPLQIIQDAGQRAADVVADLLTVARGAAATKQLTQLNSVVSEYLKAPELKYPCSANPEITIKTELADDLMYIECSPVHIRKCILNLTLNAMEASGQSGTVTISTKNRYIDTPVRGYDNVRPGEYVILSVKDTGEGIAPQDLEHIFEPFYTKKIMGRSGTGLGLAVVWNTVQDHDGYIDVITSPEGTCFEIYFPATRDVPEHVIEKDSMNLSRGNGETVLVIDDEDYQRDIAYALLKHLGYKPHTVASGEEAIEFLSKSPVDLLLLDMIMNPGISGRQTYEQIIRMYPGQPAVIASGFSKTEDVKHTQKLGAGCFIKKPYTLTQLGTAVARELKR